MESNSQPKSTLASEQEALWYLGGQRIIEALGERLAGAVCVTELAPPATTFVSAQRRQQEDEAQFVLAGEATVACAGHAMTVSAGALLFLPGGVPYQMQVSATGPLRYLTWLTPAGFAHEVTRMGTPNEALLLAPPSAPDRAKIQRLADLLRATTIWRVLE